VRGKEVKNVEFGAKCNNIFVDGISFIEKLSFNAFCEGTRLEQCIKMHKRLFVLDKHIIGKSRHYFQKYMEMYIKNMTTVTNKLGEKPN
jgi:hypothetical protein